MSAALTILMVFIFLNMFDNHVGQGIFGLVGVIGAVTGTASFCWQIYDKYIYKPKIDLMAEIVYKNEKPKEIKHVAINHGKYTEALCWGFSSSDGYFVVSYSAGLIPRRLKKGIPHEHCFEIVTIAESVKNSGRSIKYIFIQDDNKIFHIKEVPLDILHSIEEVAQAEVEKEQI